MKWKHENDSEYFTALLTGDWLKSISNIIIRYTCKCYTLFTESDIPLNGQFFAHFVEWKVTWPIRRLAAQSANWPMALLIQIPRMGQQVYTWLYKRTRASLSPSQYWIILMQPSAAPRKNVAKSPFVKNDFSWETVNFFRRIFWNILQ